jgi:2-polyprenyl-6-hydroxyphenyl methylase/3-demethylubiquinone-9 3-methyltransferase
LKWVPKGTHDWQKFIPPKQLIHYLEQSNFHPVEMKGMHYRLDQNRFYLSDDLSMNYICCAKKNSIPG